MKRGGLVGLAGAAAFGAMTTSAVTGAAEVSTDARCQNRSICASRSVEYVGAHTAATAGLALLAVVTDNALDPKVPDATPFSRTMQGAADGLLALELTLPAAAYTATMRTPEIADASFSYAQSTLLAVTFNHLLRYGKMNSSAPVAFAAAVTSSLLLEQRGSTEDGSRPPVDVRVRGTFWGLQFSLATANGILAARSGRSRAGGVVLGGSLGIGLALLTDAVHREKVEAPAPSFVTAENGDCAFIWGVNAGLLTLGILLPLLPDPPSDDPALRYSVSPAMLGPGAAGAALQGAF